jgi:hypothetical protein
VSHGGPPRATAGLSPGVVRTDEPRLLDRLAEEAQQTALARAPSTIDVDEQRLAAEASHVFTQQLFHRIGDSFPVKSIAG